MCGGPTVTLAAEGPPAFRGNAYAYTLMKEPKPAPYKPFVGADDHPIDTDALRGKVILLNFWATWCAPCREEMPALDKLQGAMGGKHFQVITLSVDRAGLEPVIAFMKGLKLKHLKTYLDPGRANYRSFGVPGLPTTFLIDHKGMVVGYLLGAADWGSEGARKLIAFYVARAKRDDKK